METINHVLEQRHPQFNTISPEAAVSDALHQMTCENIDFLVVIKDERFSGVISEHDIASKILTRDIPLRDIKVKEFMTRTLPVATSSDSIEHGLQMLERFNARYLAIFDNFDFKGIISLHDLMHQALNKNNKLENSESRGYAWNY